MAGPEILPQPTPETTVTRTHVLGTAAALTGFGPAFGVVSMANKFLRETKVGRGATGIVAVGALGLFTAGVRSCSSPVKITDEITASAPPATYEGSFIYENPIKCWGGYQVQINGVRAEFDAKPTIFGKDLPTVYSQSQTKNGRVDVVLCSKPTKVAGTYRSDGSKKTASITFGSDSFVAIVSSDPLRSQYVSGNNMGAAPQKITDAVLKAFEGTPYVGDAAKNLDAMSPVDRIDSNLKGVTDLIGYGQATGKCVDLAWKDLAGPAPDGSDGPLKQAIVTDIAKNEGVAAADTTVNLPRKITLLNQYSSEFTDLQNSPSVKDGSLVLSIPDINTLQCEPSPNHHTVIPLPDGVQLPNNAPTGGH